MEINDLRQRVAEEESRRKSEKAPDKDDMDMDSAAPASTVSEDKAETTPAPLASNPSTREADMEVDDGAAPKEPSSEKKDEATAMQADDDDAVEY